MLASFLHLIGRPLYWLADPDAEDGITFGFVKGNLGGWIWILYVVSECIS